MLIQDAIQRLVKDRTTFVIAHRLSTIHNADLIVALDGGHVVEMGTHDELLEKDGLYSRLHRAQFRTPNNGVDRETQPAEGQPQAEFPAPDDEKPDQMIEPDQPDDWTENSDT